ncbi:MAG: hypothetical protein HY720_18600 [Planctomycetes bacterium]|nr:hypothetical protein [Planctomycetota bacterium]
MRRLPPRTGALLVEILMATAIFVLVTQIFFTLSEQKMRSIRIAEERTMAAIACDREIDGARACSTEKLAGLDGSTFAVRGLPGRWEEAGRIEVGPVEGHPELRKVVATVRWPAEGRGDEQKVSLSGLVRARGGNE